MTRPARVASPKLCDNYKNDSFRYFLAHPDPHLHLLPELRHEISVVLELVLHRGALLFGARLRADILGSFWVLDSRAGLLDVLLLLLLPKFLFDLCKLIYKIYKISESNFNFKCLISLPVASAPRASWTVPTFARSEVQSGVVHRHHRGWTTSPRRRLQPF